jgi:uncharacterized protein (DUF433 family)
MGEQALIDRWIEPNPHRPDPAEAVLKSYGVSVWALVGYLAMVCGDAARVAQDYEIPLEAVEAALAYYRRHQPLIDARIAANLAA